MTIKLTTQDIERRANEIATELKGMHKPKVYGIPRGGVPCAFALVHALGRGSVVETIDEADVIVDDIVDSGATRERFMQHARPDAQFKSFYTSTGEWLVFPWEGDEHSSASDIPVRLLQYVGEKPERGGLAETPKRFLKAWQHFTSGYAVKDEDIKKLLKVFEDGAPEECDEMVLIKSIPVYSQCEHHLVPFFGVAHIAYIPDGKIVGLSKFSRLVDVFARRLQVQERLTNQIADAMQKHLQPKGVAVVLECRHLCMEARGIQQQGSSTTTSAMRGAFRNPAPRAEFMGLIKG